MKVVIIVGHNPPRMQDVLSSLKLNTKARVTAIKSINYSKSDLKSTTYILLISLFPVALLPQ